MSGSLGGSAVKKLTAVLATSEVVRSPGQEGPWRRKWQPLQYSCLDNPADRGTWWATVHGFKKSRTRLRWLSRHAQSWERGRMPISKNLGKPQTKALSFSERQVSLLLFKNKTCPNCKTNCVSYLLLRSRLSPHLPTLNNRHLSAQCDLDPWAARQVGFQLGLSWGCSQAVGGACSPLKAALLPSWRWC